MLESQTDYFRIFLNTVDEFLPTLFHDKCMLVFHVWKQVPALPVLLLPMRLLRQQGCLLLFTTHCFEQPLAAFLCSPGIAQVFHSGALHILKFEPTLILRGQESFCFVCDNLHSVIGGTCYRFRFLTNCHRLLKIDYLFKKKNNMNSVRVAVYNGAYG